MKTRLITRISSVLALVAMLSSAAAVRSAAPDCAVAGPAAFLGTYGADGSAVSGSFINGRINAGGASEYRGFLVFQVPASDRPYVSGEIRVSVDYVLTTSPSEVLQLRHVATALDVLTNYAGAKLNTFRDLGTGPLLGFASFPYRAQLFTGGIPDRQASIPLSADAIAYVNAARGKQMAFGASLPGLAANPGAVEEVGLLQRPGNFTLILQRGDADVPQAAILNVTNSVVGGGSFTFSGLACGTEPMTRQWFKDGVAVKGATNSLYVIDTVHPAQAGRYEFRACNVLGNASSDPFDLRVAPAAINSFSGDLTAVDGEAGVCLNVNALSYITTEYLWRRNGIEIRRTSFPSFCFPQVSMADAGNYDVVVSNNYGSVTSVVAVVTVLPRAPLLSYVPSGLIDAAAGLPYFLEGQAYGTEPISYVWFKNQSPVSGTTGGRLSFGALGLGDAGDYQLVVSNSYGSVTSQVAQLRVSAAILNGPFDTQVQMGSRVVLWPQPLAAPGTRYDWYRDDVLLPGTGISFLVFSAASTNDTGGYLVVASNSFGSVTSRVAQLVVTLAAPSVSIYSGKIMPSLAGEDFTLGVNLSGGPSPTLQWMRNGVDLPGETNLTLQLRNVRASDVGNYTVRAVNLLGSATSDPFRVDVVVQAPVFTLVPFNTNEVVGSLITLQSHAAAGPGAQYQWRRDGTDLPGATNATLVFQSASAGDAGRYQIVARNSEGEAVQDFDLHLRPQTGLDRWDWRLPRPQGSRLRDITWGDGRFVAVGKSGDVVTSLDGTNWSHVLIDADCDLRSVAYGNGRFVAIGTTHAIAGSPLLGPGSPTAFVGGLILTSTNGIDWTSSASPAWYPLRIAFGAGRFVMAANGDLEGTDQTPIFAYTSADGVGWTAERFGYARADRVVFVNDEFWANDWGGLYRSSDGLSWSNATRSILGEALGPVGYGGGLYVAMGAYGQRGQSSRDGLVWEPFDLENLNIQSLAYGNGRFVATLGSPFGAIITSVDGRSWTQSGTSTTQELESILFVEGQFWAVGEAGAIIHSVDGVSWSPNLVESGTDYYGLARLGEQVVAAGDSGTILTSTNGESWTRRSTPSGRNLHSIHAASGLVVAGGRGGRIMTSPDAINWTSRSSGTTNYVERIDWTDGWVAVCEGGDVLTSQDGVAWSATRTQPASDHEGLAYGAGYWVVVGGYFRNGESGSAVSTVFVSADAVHWTLMNVNVGVRLRDVVFANGVFVAVGNDGLVVVLAPTGDPLQPIQYVTSYGVMALAPYWPQFENFRRIRFQNGVFMAVGNDGGVLSTTDPLRAESWVQHRSRTSQNLHDILPAPDGTYYAVGNNGMILRSGAPQPYFTGIRFTSTGVRVEFSPATLPGPFRLEESPDLQTWDLVTDRAVSPVDLPFVHPGARYFRLR